MRTKQELELLKEQAVTLRRQGKSLRQIKQILGPMSNVTLHDALRGVPPPDWTLRPNAKDEQRAKARELRAQGLDYEEIATALGVAKGSVSLWVRDLPRPARLSYAECRKRSAEGSKRYWEGERAVREARRQADRAAAAAQIGDLSDRSSSPAPSPTGARAPRISPTGAATGWSSRTATRHWFDSSCGSSMRRELRPQTCPSASASTRTLTQNRPSGSGWRLQARGAISSAPRH
jgi:transposase